MIITLKLTNTTASSGDYLIIDNCTDLRTTLIPDTSIYNNTKDNFEKLRSMTDYVCKEFDYVCKEFDLTVDTQFKQHPYLLEFKSNGKNYFIITEQTVYIANDQNKTIQVLN